MILNTLELIWIIIVFIGFLNGLVLDITKNYEQAKTTFLMCVCVLLFLIFEVLKLQ